MAARLKVEENGRMCCIGKRFGNALIRKVRESIE
jgi:hypothetical protein